MAVELVPVVTVLPPESWTVTTGCVVKATPLVADALGCVVKANWAAAPAASVMLAVVAPVRPVDEAVSV